jgi:hypothetical protein
MPSINKKQRTLILLLFIVMSIGLTAAMLVVPFVVSPLPIVPEQSHPAPPSAYDRYEEKSYACADQWGAKKKELASWYASTRGEALNRRGMRIKYSEKYTRCVVYFYFDAGNYQATPSTEDNPLLSDRFGSSGNPEIQSSVVDPQEKRILEDVTVFGYEQLVKELFLNGDADLIKGFNDQIRMFTEEPWH